MFLVGFEASTPFDFVLFGILTLGGPWVYVFVDSS
jgi:hypothetical protein